MSAIELHVCDTIISLNARGLLEPSLDVLVNCTEDSNLALQNLLIRADLHLPNNVVDETVSRWLVKHFVPKRAWRVEVLGSNLAQEGDSCALEVTVSLVKINGTLTELNGVDGTQIIGTRALVIESHRSVTLKVTTFEASARSVDRQLLIVCANTVTVRIWI